MNIPFPGVFHITWMPLNYDGVGNWRCPNSPQSAPHLRPVFSFHWFGREAYTDLLDRLPEYSTLAHDPTVWYGAEETVRILEGIGYHPDLRVGDKTSCPASFVFGSFEDFKKRVQDIDRVLSGLETSLEERAHFGFAGMSRLSTCNFKCVITDQFTLLNTKVWRHWGRYIVKATEAALQFKYVEDFESEEGDELDTDETNLEAYLENRAKAVAPAKPQSEPQSKPRPNHLTLI